jgi:hypothetical protein
MVIDSLIWKYILECSHICLVESIVIKYGRVKYSQTYLKLIVFFPLGLSSNWFKLTRSDFLLNGLVVLIN